MSSPKSEALIEYERGWNDAMAAVAVSALPAAQESAARAERERVTRIIRDQLALGGLIDREDLLVALGVKDAKSALKEGGA